MTVNVHHIREGDPARSHRRLTRTRSARRGAWAKPIGGSARFLNAHLVADAIGTGLGTVFDVTVVPVSHVSAADLADAELVVVGGPDHAHGMSRVATRKAAAEAAAEAGGGLEGRAGMLALGPGLREWFVSLRPVPQSRRPPSIPGCTGLPP